MYICIYVYVYICIYIYIYVYITIKPLLFHASHIPYPMASLQGGVGEGHLSEIQLLPQLLQFPSATLAVQQQLLVRSLKHGKNHNGDRIFTEDIYIYNIISYIYIYIINIIYIILCHIYNKYNIYNIMSYIYNKYNI